MNLISVSKSISPLHAAISLNNRNLFDGRYFIIHGDSDHSISGLLRRSGIVPIHEKELSQHVSMNLVRDLLRPELRARAGWYFQQFLQIAGGLFLPYEGDLVLCGADLFLTKRFAHRSPTGAKYLSLIPHGKRNWGVTHRKLGATLMNENECFVAEHVVTEKRILDFIVRFYDRHAVQLDEVFKNFVQFVISAVNQAYDEVKEMYGRQYIKEIEHFMLEDLFSEYQYISIMSMNNFANEYVIRNISHIRFFSHRDAVVDRGMDEGYEVIVFEP